MAEIQIERKSTNKWLLPVIGALLLIALVSWFSNRDSDRTANASTMNDTSRTVRDSAR